MHELSICESLLEQVEQVAAQHGSVEVHKIVLVVGPLSGADSQLLRHAFSVARIGTVAISAELEIETAQVVVWCPSCDVGSPVAPNALLCGRCGTWRVELRSGDELLLKRIELTAAEAAA